MTWGVVYRPPELRRFGQSNTATTPFKLPLSRAILDDPAFSTDPRSHPHFPLTNAASYKALPSKSSLRISHPLPMPFPDPPPSSPSLSSESDSLTLFSPSTSPTLSSATSHSQSPTQSRDSHSPLSLSPSNPVSPKIVSKTPPQRHSSLLASEIPSKSDNTKPLAKDNPKPAALRNTNIPRKGRMKALVRRLTSRHNLDRIDELDETDPSGVSYHHDGPYEAIGSNIAPHSLPRKHSNTVPRGGNIHYSKQREFHPRPLRFGQHRSPSRVPSTYGNTGLSLNLEPGQILQRNTIYSSHAPSMVSVPSQFRPQPNTISGHSRSSSLPNTRTRSPDDSSSLELLHGFQNRPSSFLHTPRKRYFGDNTPDIPSNLPLPHDHDAAPYVPHQTQTTIFPPPGYESRFHSSGPPQPPQRTPQPSNRVSWQTQSTESAVPALPLHELRHKSIYSLDSSNALNGTITSSSSSIQNKQLEPPRIRHLPKRLVMPTPLQLQLPQQQHKLPPTEAAAWQDEHMNNNALEGARFEGQPATYTQTPRLLRKGSSAFPVKTPIPDHVPMSQDDAVPTRDSPTKTVNETEERTRRRRLSKRKNDV